MFEISYQSIDVKILHLRNIIKPTKNIYRNCLKDFIHICENEYTNYSSLTSKNQNNYLEKLVHKTKDNTSPKYDWFDDKYFQMPSYFRRACLQEAKGIVNSFHSNYNNWVEGGKVGKLPVLRYNHSSFPTFYKNNTFMWNENNNIMFSNNVSIKLYNNKTNTWNYVTISLRLTDVKRLFKLSNGNKLNISNPTLCRKGKCWYLKFLVTNTRNLINIENKKQRILAVDLGYTNLATCCVMEEDGTILHRKFIKNVKLIDRLSHTLNRIKKAQKLGAKKPKYLWHKVNNYNETLATYCALEIVKLASEFHCDTIVLEYLDFKNSNMHGAMKQKISLWGYRDINKKVERIAHRNGIHYSTICAKNTSKLAYDGSGSTIRGNKINKNTPYSICKFKSGKLYNCDLNASYNIGARYFIKKIQKTIDESLWSLMMVKVPSLRARVLCTLDSLIKVRQLLPTM